MPQQSRVSGTKDVGSWWHVCPVLKWLFCFSNWLSCGAQTVMNTSPTSYLDVGSPLTLTELGEWHSRLLGAWESVAINAWPLNVLSVLTFSEPPSRYMQTQGWVWQSAHSSYKISSSSIRYKFKSKFAAACCLPEVWQKFPPNDGDRGVEGMPYKMWRLSMVYGR